MEEERGESGERNLWSWEQGRGREHERGRGSCARTGSQGCGADLLGYLGLCYGLQADCHRLAGT